MNRDEKVLKIVSNMEIIKEKKAENKDLLDEVMQDMLKKGERMIIVPIPFSENHYVEVRLKDAKKKVVDKVALAAQADVPKEELTLYGISKFTKDGVITPQMIKDNTRTEIVTKAKVKRKKAKKKKGEGK